MVNLFCHPKAMHSTVIQVTVNSNVNQSQRFILFFRVKHEAYVLQNTCLRKYILLSFYKASMNHIINNLFNLAFNNTPNINLTSELET